MISSSPPARDGPSPSLSLSTRCNQQLTDDLSITESGMISYDSDEEPPIDEGGRLDWRLEPAQSHSDYDIEVQFDRRLENEDSITATQVYHVHRNILAVGPKRSEYFARLLQGSFLEMETNTSKIQLDEVAANAFPYMLDYIYERNETLAITSETAVALHWLGQYFEIRRLRWEVRQFWRRDLSLENCHIYYEHAVLLSDFRILHAVADLCANQLLELSRQSPIVQASHPEFFLSLMKHISKKYATGDIAPDLSKHASCLMVEVLLRWYDIANTDGQTLFAQLTDAELLPEIDSSVALTFLELSLTMNEPDGIRSRDVSEDLTADNEGKLTSLQQRCIKAVAKDWNDIQLSQPETIRLFRELKSPLIWKELLADTVYNAKESVSLQKAKLLLSKVTTTNLRNDLLDASNCLKRMERSLRKKDATIQQYKTCCEASLIRIRELEEELMHFKPVPANYSKHDLAIKDTVGRLTPLHDVGKDNTLCYKGRPLYYYKAS